MPANLVFDSFCRRKKKCIKFTSADDTGSDEEDGCAPSPGKQSTGDEKATSEKDDTDSIPSPPSSHGGNLVEGGFDHPATHREEGQSLPTTPVTSTGAGIAVLANPTQSKPRTESFSSAFQFSPIVPDFRGAAVAAGPLRGPERQDSTSSSVINNEAVALPSPSSLPFSSPTCVTPPFSSSLSSPLMMASLASPGSRFVTGGTPTSVLERPSMPMAASS